MFAFRLSCGQSSFTVRLRAMRYFLRSSVIYYKPCGVCDGLNPPTPTHFHPRIQQSACVYVSMLFPPATPPPLPRRTLCRGEVMTTEEKNKEGEKLGSLLHFAVYSPCFQVLGGGGVMV